MPRGNRNAIEEQEETQGENRSQFACSDWQVSWEVNSGAPAS